ncbi:MAG: 3-phosphoglycerate dehydrogenase [Planctomycetaceae bacterium]|nr:3-phosphoglycerate dehydrogenase [Planctomycetaceae bacterium]
MFRPRVVIPADSPPLVGASPCLAQLDEIADVVLYRDRPADDQEKVRRVSEADILLNSRGSLKFPQEVLQQLPRLKMIAVCGIGYDAIDLPTATEHRIVVCNVPGRTATVVAEHALGLMFAVARNMAFQTLELKAGRWRGDLGVSLTGRQIGVIGTGNIGCEMIRLCRAVGMKPVAWSLHPDPAKAARLGFEYVTLEELLKTSDVVSLHTRLSDQTRGLMNAERFAMMKRGSILINTARGAMVETNALVEALESGHLFGAGLDVYDEEPLRADHPILQCARVVLTPHTADTTQEGLDVLTLGCIDNIRAFLNGNPQNVVNPDVLRGH